jgi:uncharacterized membrane protein HdeD (DUF308 family)
MESQRPVDDTLFNAAPWRLHSWKASFAMGLLTLILGVIVAFRPSGSLVVISVLLGILMIFSGVFHIVAAVDAPEHHKTWRAIAGVLFIVGGIILMRHLQFSLALIGLIVGFTWVIQGVSSLIGGFSHRDGRAWKIFFGIVSLLAGIVVISVPVTSLVFLTTFLGVWFAVIGVFEMVDAFMSRHTWDGTEATGQVSVPGQRPETEVPDAEAAGGMPGGGSTATGRNVQG